MITAIIPTLNEEKFIKGAIESVAFADEIIIIDSFSTDDTVAVAKKHQVTIIQRRFDDFSSQKNFAIDRAKNDWIYILDADERVPNELKEEIVKAVESPGNRIGFFIYRTFYFKKRLIKYGGWQTDKVMRLFKKENGRYDGKLVHERIEYKGEFGFLNARINHYSYRNFKQYRDKLCFYAKLQAKELLGNGQKVYLFQSLFKPGFRFVVLYLLRFGFLDGKRGFILAKLHAKSVSQRYMNYRLLKKKLN